MREMWVALPGYGTVAVRAVLPSGQYLHVPKQSYGCQCLGFLTCIHMHCAWGLYRHRETKRVCIESWLREHPSNLIIIWQSIPKWSKLETHMSVSPLELYRNQLMNHTATPSLFFIFFGGVETGLLTEQWPVIPDNRPDWGYWLLNACTCNWLCYNMYYFIWHSSNRHGCQGVKSLSCNMHLCVYNISVMCTYVI